MRQLKFRAWNENSLQMLYTDWNSFRNWYDLPTGGHVIYGRGFDGEKIILSEPMQFTERKDKNNIELYERDVVKWINNYGEENIGWVRYSKTMAGFYIVLIKGSYQPFYTGSQQNFAWGSLEIIGNTYNNPKLMETNK